MKKIAIILPGKYPLPPVKGGAVENLVQSLLIYNEIDPHFYFDVYSQYDPDAALLAKEYKYTRLVYISTTNFNYKIGRVLRWVVNHVVKLYIGNQFIHSVIKKIDVNYDIILIENAPWYVIPLKKYINTKIVQHLHNSYLNNCNYRNQLILKKTDFIFAVSNFIKREILTTHKDIGNNIVHVLHNGISLERFGNISNDLKERIRKELGICATDFVFIFSGRLVPDKGIRELLLAMNQIRKNSIKLLIIGASGFANSKVTPFVDELKEISKENPNIIFTGYVDYNKIQFYYALGNVAIVPSIWEDPFPLSCLEFMALGLPLIVTNSGGVVEAVNQECAIVLKKESDLIKQLVNSMNYLYSNPDICNKMAQAAQRRSLLFSDKNYWNNFVQLIDAI